MPFVRLKTVRLAVSLGGELVVRASAGNGAQGELAQVPGAERAVAVVRALRPDLREVANGGGAARGAGFAAYYCRQYGGRTVTIRHSLRGGAVRWQRDDRLGQGLVGLGLGNCTAKFHCLLLGGERCEGRVRTAGARP